MKKSLILIIIALLVVSTAFAWTVKGRDRDGDGWNDMWMWDTNNDSKYDQWAFDDNGDVVRYPRLFIVHDGTPMPYEEFVEEGGKLPPSPRR